MDAIRLALFGALLAGLASCSDPEKDATALFVDAAAEIQGASTKGEWDRYQAYSSAEKKLDSITSQFKSTQAALKIASSEKIGGLTAAELKQQIVELKDSPGVCLALKNADCTMKLIKANITKMLAVDEKKTVDGVGNAIVKLKLSGLDTDVDEILGMIAKKIGVPSISEKTNAVYPKLVGEFLNSAASAYNEHELTVLYENVLKWPAIAANPNGADDMRVKLISELNLRDHSVLALRVVKDAGGDQQPLLASIAMRGLSNGYETNPPVAIVEELIGFAQGEDRVDALAGFAGVGEKERVAAFKLAQDEDERSKVTVKLIASGMKAFSTEERLSVLEGASPETLRANPRPVLEFALEGKEKKAVVEGLLDKTLPLSDPENQRIAQTVREIVSGAKNESALVDLVYADRQRVCEIAPGLLRSAERFDLMVPLATACLPASSGYASPAMLTNIAGAAAQGGDGGTLEAVLKILRTSPAWKENLYDILYSTLYHGKFEQTFAEVKAAGRFDGGIYTQLLKTSLEKGVGNPVEVVDAAIANGGYFDAWTVPDVTGLSKQSLANLDKLISERGEVLAAIMMRDPSSFMKLDPDRLLVLASKVQEDHAKPAIFSALAKKARLDSKPEVLAAAWTLPSDPSEIVERLTTLKLNETLSKSAATQ
ncbi:hypothetical protein QO002_001139 [Pararhizobium capsulatum DSM 1112]|uniref:HEAT repeat domain-containing protein n=1 Tax=Pararhizobium capsulatum DSM 1112 TaxID=1121113 RepID=A0ABU0BL73_9HYPH|nr:hypothetical protein [Pararhizobium capsulatum]MDQ0319001.1 hypothetical protein [Pararhizobium capsulatum DSM 1112]